MAHLAAWTLDTVDTVDPVGTVDTVKWHLCVNSSITGHCGHYRPCQVALLAHTAHCGHCAHCQVALLAHLAVWTLWTLKYCQVALICQKQHHCRSVVVLCVELTSTPSSLHYSCTVSWFYNAPDWLHWCFTFMFMYAGLIESIVIVIMHVNLRSS